MDEPRPDTEIDPEDVQETREQSDAEFEEREDEIDEQVQSITEKINDVLDRDAEKKD